MISYLKKLKFEGALKSHPNFGYTPKLTDYNRGSSVAILSNYEHKDVVARFVKELRVPLAKIAVLYYSTDPSLEAHTYSKKEVNWAGVPISDQITDFLEKEYDRFFLLDKMMHPHYAFICKLVKCRFSVGPLLPNDEFHFDLCIDIENKPVDYLASKILKGLDYLSDKS